MTPPPPLSTPSLSSEAPAVTRLREGGLGAGRGYARRLGDKSGYTTPAGALASITRVIGATSAGKERLEAWLRRPDAPSVSEAARARGTWTHAQIEAWIRGEATQRHFAFGAYWRNVRPWLEEHFVEAAAIETPVWHPAGFAGTFDALGFATYGTTPRPRDALTLFDWKTAARTRDGDLLEDYFVQLGAYTAAVEYTFGVRPERALLVIARPHRDGPDVHELTTAALAHYEAAFMERLQRYYAPQCDIA